MKLWPFPSRSQTVEERSISIADPAVAVMLGLSNGYGIQVSESTAMTLSAVYRAISLIAGVGATLPLRTLVQQGDQKERAASFLDTPHGRDGMTAFEWKELVLVHLLLHGNAYLQHIYNTGGALVALHPIHPLQVSVEEAPQRPGGKLFKVRDTGGQFIEFDARTMTHIPGISLDGLRGISPIGLARQSLGVAMSGDKAAAKMFQNGAMVSGLVTPSDGEDLTEAEATVIKNSLSDRMTGVDNVGDIAVINRRLKFEKWSMSPVDAQFLESRSFQIEEIARWYGVPPHLLGQTDKQTSWGTGVAEQNRGLARYTMTPWTSRIEQRLSRLLVPSKTVEFDYTAFVKPSPEDEIALLIQQVESGLITPNEARRVRNMPPLPGGDTPRVGGSAGNSSEVAE